MNIFGKDTQLKQLEEEQVEATREKLIQFGDNNIDNIPIPILKKGIPQLIKEYKNKHRTNWQKHVSQALQNPEENIQTVELDEQKIPVISTPVKKEGRFISSGVEIPWAKFEIINHETGSHKQDLEEAIKTRMERILKETLPKLKTNIEHNRKDPDSFPIAVTLAGNRAVGLNIEPKPPLS